MIKAIKNKFVILSCRLSPENLTCDGELSRAQVEKRSKAIWRAWGKLERQIGRKVEESEVAEWMTEHWD